MKRDDANVSFLPDAAAVMPQLPAWFEHYNTVNPHRVLSYRPPREFIVSRPSPENTSNL
jgi:putative transposase